MSTELVERAVDAIMAAEAALARAAGAFPDVGSCAIRAAIDVERGNLKMSRRHVMSALALTSSTERSNATG